MNASEVARVFHAKRVRKGQWMAKCPAHDDRKPSLSIREGKTCVLIHCWSGCDKKAILEHVGLKLYDLFYVQRTDPKVIREAEKRRQEEETAAELVSGCRQFQNETLWKWVRVHSALAWLLARNPDDKRLQESYDCALSRIREAPATWPNPRPFQAPYCPFPAQKLLHGITAQDVTPAIARILKLPR